MASFICSCNILGKGSLVSTKVSSWPLIWLQLLLFSFILPKEVAFSLGPLLLTPYRLVFIILAPYILWKLIYKRRLNWNICDYAALCVFFWPLIAYTLSSGLAVAIETGGVLILETAVPYFLTRIAITDYNSLKKLSNTLLLIIILLVIVSIPEAITGRFFIREISYTLTGNTYEYSVSQRLGLWRAMGPTTHPIILGTICASGIIISLTLSFRQRKYIAAFLLSLVGVFVSLSSAPLLAGASQVFLMSWSRLLRGNNFKWSLLALLFLALYVFVDLASNRDPFRVMFSYLLFNPGTGYARYYMWQNSIELINSSLSSMLIGYGNSTDFFNLLESQYWAYSMSQSVDSFWLVRLLGFGWPILLLHSIFLISLFRKIQQQYKKLSIKKEKKLVEAWMITAAAMTIIAFTVDFWWQTASFYYIILAAPISITTSLKRHR